MSSVFFSYSHKDEDLRDQLETQLAALKRQGVIETWHDRRIGAGEELHYAIDDRINSCDVILLLVSPDFIASDYCYDVEMRRAMKRHEEGSATVIPVILRACDWHGLPFGRLNAVPKDGRPVKSLPDIDEAFLQVAKAVRTVAEKSAGARQAQPAIAPASTAPIGTSSSPPRSSNLRIAKEFTQRDKDNFKIETFEYIAKYFENSLAELERRNDGVEGTFRRIDANRFFAVVYRGGNAIARGTVYVADNNLGNGINYAQGEVNLSNTMNESMTVNADDQSLYMHCLGMSMWGKADQKLSQEGAAEILWNIFIRPTQISINRR